MVLALILVEDGGEIFITAVNWGGIPPEFWVWIDLVEDLRKTNIVNSIDRLCRSFLLLRPLLRDLLWLLQSDAATGLLLGDCWLASLS